MKETMIALSVLTVLMFSGCANQEAGHTATEAVEQNNVQEETAQETDANAKEMEGAGSHIENINPDGFVVLGEYKGMGVEIQEVEITDEDVQSFIKELATTYEDFDGKIQKGDVAIVNIETSKDGEILENLSEEGTSFIIGETEMLAGYEWMENDLVGKTNGEEFSHTDNESGLQFTLEIIETKRPVVSEINDEWVKEISEGEYENLDDFKKEVKFYLEETNKPQTDLSTAIFNKAMENAKVVVPEQVAKDLTSQIIDQLSKKAEEDGKSLGVELSLRYGIVAKDESDIENAVRNYVFQNVGRERMLFAAIVKAENIKIAESEVEEARKTLNKAGEDMSDEDIKDHIYMEKVLDLLVDLNGREE